jgi:uncharacterized protein YecE (DUF72 family)
MPEARPTTELRVGCSGWNYAHWRERVYPRGLPPRRWLARYAGLFDTVEVNATFYRLPRRDAVIRWAEATPPDFVFTIKASRYLTHIRRLRDLPPGIDLLYERIGPLVDEGKLGPVLWQLPESFHRDDERLAAALEALPGGRHCFEFRHPSWFHDDVYALLRQHGVALVLGDIPSRPFQTRERTADWTFVRFHYGRRGRRGNYSDRELAEWATWLSEQTAAGDVYAYFNNDWEGFAVRNGLRLRRLLAAQLAESTGVVVTQPGGPTGAPAAGRTAGRGGG